MASNITSATSRPLRQLPGKIQDKLRADFPRPDIMQAKRDFYEFRGVDPASTATAEKQPVDAEWTKLFTQFARQEKANSQPYQIKKS